MSYYFFDRGDHVAKSKMIKVQDHEDEQLVLFLYARVSTDRQAEEGYSIDIQKERLIGYVSSMFGEKKYTYELFIDDGYSGGSLKRPEMQRMISRIQNGEGTHVIVYKLDRLSRSQKDTLYLIEDVFLKNNVAFISMMESFNTATSFGRAVVGILSVFAQLERENIFERTRSGMQKRVELGYWPGGGGVPFGYDYDQNQGILVPNKDADTVRSVYDLYLQGYSLQRIANMLGLRYDKLAQQILCRKTNAGYIVFNGGEYKGLHEPLISLETYEKAMRRFEEKSKSKTRSSGTNHLLTGLVVCGKCGAKMRYMKWGPQGYKLVCYSRQKSKPYLVKDPNCDNPTFPAPKIEEIVINDLFSMTKKDYRNTNGTVLSTNAIEILEQEYQTTEKALKRLYMLYATSDDDALVETINETKSKLADLNAKIEVEKEAAQYADRILQAEKEITNIQAIWPDMTDMERREAIRSVVKEITLTDQKINIEYKI